MFRQFAAHLPGGAEYLFRLHPIELAALLEQAWEFRVHSNDPSVPVGHPDRRSSIPGLPAYLLDAFDGYARNRQTFMKTSGHDRECPDGCVRWEHLIYAYMVENTRIVDLFRRVVHEFRHGEELGVPLEGSEHWLRNTEELFLRDPAPFSIASLTSSVRPVLDATRRNAYHRMFGMDLNHGGADGQPVVYLKSSAANVEFVSTFEEFLREVWIGIIHVGNSSGVKPTDDSKIANLAEKLHDMLRTRRLNGNLAREEFYFVAMMSWFHLTIETDSMIVKSLRAEGASPEQRLFKIGTRVKLPAHSQSKSFFDLAEVVSRVLIQIETGIYNAEAAVPALYSPGLVQQDMRRIITHWSITTGRDLKSGKVTQA